MSTLQTVDRAIEFLETVATSPTPLTIREISTKLGLNITTCYHVFNTLLARNYVERSADNTLRIGFQAAVLYDGYRRGFSAIEQIQSFVADLASATSETAWLSRRMNDRVVLTSFVEGPLPVKATGLYVGLAGQEHRRAAGRAVLAFLDAEARERMLANSMAKIPPQERRRLRKVLERELERVRALGWSIDDEAFNTGIIGIAAPYYSAAGEVDGAVGIWAPAERVRETLDVLASRVVQAGQTATRLFSHHV